MRTLRQCLFDYDLALLRVLAAQWSVELPTNRHDDAVDVLAPRLSDPAFQADLWASLPEAERRALAALLSTGGSMPTGAFTRRWGEIRPMGPGRLERERPWESPISLAESLWYRGLIFKEFDQGPGGMQEVVFVPQELQSTIKVEHTTHASAVLVPMPAPEARKQAGAQLADDLCSFLAYIHATPIGTAPGRPLPEQHARTLARQLRDQNPIRLDLLTCLAAQLGLLKPDTTPLRPDPQTVTAWLQSSTPQQQRLLFEGWRESTTWNDLWRAASGSLCHEPVSSQRMPGARQEVLDTLAKLEVGAWYRVDNLVTFIHETSPDFQRPGGDYDTWYIRDAATNQYLRGFESWDQVEGALLRFIVSGPLHWLGVVVIDTDGTAFSVTAIGYWVLSAYAGDAPALEESTSFIIQAEGQVQVSAPRRYDRFQLARVADWVESGETYTYCITPSSLERAKMQRITPERIIEFLERTSKSPVPELLAGALRRWSARGTEAWAQEAIALRVARPELLDQLMNSPRTRKFIRETVSSTVALVAPRDWPELFDALFEMGILPDYSNFSPGSTSKSHPAR